MPADPHHAHGVALEVKRHLLRDEIAEVTDLLAVVAEHDGLDPLGEHQWLDLVTGGRNGFAGLVASAEGHEHPVGYAQVARSETHEGQWSLDVVVSPHHREDGSIGSVLLGAALEVVREEGGGHVHLWTSRPGPLQDRMAAEHGLRRGRDLYQMRVPLPLDVKRTDLVTRPFVVGQDEEAWLEVNNAAFDWHPEQGGWDLVTLRERQAAPWFDADGFLLHESAGELGGFCWTKVHPPRNGDPQMGEIYVVAVAPGHQGTGLGRALTVAGLDHLHDVRGCEVGMLYVEATNRAAVRLYTDLGFVVHHTDRAYVIDV